MSISLSNTGRRSRDPRMRTSAAAAMSRRSQPWERAVTGSEPARGQVRQAQANARSFTGTTRWSRTSISTSPVNLPSWDMELVPRARCEADVSTAVRIDPGVVHPRRPLRSRRAWRRRSKTQRLRHADVQWSRSCSGAGQAGRICRAQSRSRDRRCRESRDPIVDLRVPAWTAAWQSICPSGKRS